MNIRQIDGINQTVRHNRNDPLYSIGTPNWCGCFVGNLREWKNFQAENKKNIEWHSNYELKFKNGERWDWLQEGKEANRGARYSRMIVPRRIDYQYFICEVFPSSYGCCTEIEWYGEPEKFDYY